MRLLTLALLPALFAQQSQNPSPMVEHTREHPRLKEERPPGQHEKLPLGTLFVPEKLKGAKQLPLFVPLRVQEEDDCCSQQDCDDLGQVGPLGARMK